MANKEFADRLNKLVTEGVYGFGAKMLPVDTAAWPNTTAEPAPVQEPEVVANEPLPSSTQSVVTNGETTPMGEPRADIAASNTGVGKMDDEAMTEVASLLLTIGFIMQKAGCIADKYNIDEVLEHLNQYFAPCCDTPDAASATVVAVEPVAGLTEENSLAIVKVMGKPHNMQDLEKLCAEFGGSLREVNGAYEVIFPKVELAAKVPEFIEKVKAVPGITSADVFDKIPVVQKQLYEARKILESKFKK